MPIRKNNYSDRLSATSGYLPAGTYTVADSAYYTNFFSADINFSAVVNPKILTGVVSSARDGSPIAGATVQVGNYSVTTDSGGRYTINGIPSGTYAAIVSQPQYVTVNTTVTIPPAASTVSKDFMLTPLCPVGMLQKPKFPSLGYVETGLTPGMLTVIAGFENAIGSGNIVKTSGYRSPAYQDHFYEIWSHAIALQQVNGMQVVSSRPLQFSASGCPTCQAEADELNAEIADHFPNTFPTIVAKHSLHSDGNAVDWTISGYSDSQINTIASANNLNWKVPGEPWHFSLKSAPVGHGILVTAHSPVNILVTDPNGRRVGYNPSTTNVINEIGSSAIFSGLGTSPQTVTIDPASVLFGNSAVP